jgi:hypothetical protein
MESVTRLIVEPPAISHPIEQNSKCPAPTLEENASDSRAAPVEFAKYVSFFWTKVLLLEGPQLVGLEGTPLNSTALVPWV